MINNLSSNVTLLNHLIGAKMSASDMYEKSDAATAFVREARSTASERSMSSQPSSFSSSSSSKQSQGEWRD